MNNTTPTPGAPGSPLRGRHHPLMILAALAVLLFCLVGTAAIMGWIPSSVGGTANRQLSEADRMALAASLPQGVAPMAPARQAAGIPGQPAPQYAQGYAPETGPAYPAQPAAQAYVQPQQAPTVIRPEPVGKPAKQATQVAAANSGRDWCSNCGNVESVRTIRQRAEGSGLGAAGGAVLGGLLGNQIGGGSGRQIATVAGAVGGAVVGNQVEGNMKATTSYEIRVRLDDGSLRTFRQTSAPQWRSGDRVRIVKGRLRSVA